MSELPTIIRRFKTDAEYRADPGYNWSRLKAGMPDSLYEGAHTSMAHLRTVLERTEPRADKPAFAFGRLVHTMVLEPELIRSTYLVTEETDKRRKAYKADKARAEDEGLEIVTRADYDRAHNISAAVHNNPEWRERSGGATVEVGMAVDDPLYNMRLKGKYDMLTQDGVMVDLKTTSSLRRRDIERTIAQYHYHVQMALYWRILRMAWSEYNEFPTRMAWLFVCTSAPHETVWVDASESMVEAATIACDQLLSDVSNARALNSWATLHPTGRMVAELPPWAMPATTSISPLPPTLLDVSKSL